MLFNEYRKCLQEVLIYRSEAHIITMLIQFFFADDEIIDVIGCADEPNAAENGTSQRVSNFITINVPKSIMLQRKSFNFKVNRAKTNVVSY